MGWMVRIAVFTGIGSVPLFVILFFASGPDVAIAVLAILGMFLLLPMAIVSGIVGGLLGGLGLVLYSCPFCGTPSHPAATRGNAFLWCPECGKVEAKGFFMNRYVRTNNPPDDQG
jgi:hypothetical protein